MRTTASWWLSSMVDALRKMEYPVEDWLDSVGIQASELMDPNQRFPQDTVTQLWLLAEEKSGDDCIGFEVGQLLHPRSFNVLGYAVLSSRTVRDGFNRFIRYQSVVGESARISLVESPFGDESLIAIEFEFLGDELPVSHHTTDLAMTSSIALYQGAFTGQIPLHQVSFRRKKPKDSNRFEAFFGERLLFEQEQNLLVFSRSLMEVEIPFANEEVAAQNEALVQKFLMRTTQPANLSAKVEALISETLADGAPSKEKIAKELGMSAKTLERRLKEEDKSFQQILTDVRRSMAEKLVLADEISLNEVAYLLGFSESTNFHRAFKRWFDMTPSEFREQSNRNKN